MTFRRHLSPDALAAFLALAPVLQDWAGRDRCSVELRQGDEVSCYFRGRLALALRVAGAGRWDATPFRAGSAVLRGADAVVAALDHARRAIQAHLASDGGELDLQADLVAATRRAAGPTLVVDQQVAVPRSALTSDEHARFRVDLLAMHRATGVLWLVEIKTATADDLDGDVRAQLDLTARLPGALVGGEAAFLSAIRQVVHQKRTLGLLPPDAPDPVGPVGTVLVAIGPAAQSNARITCWDDAPDHHGTLLDAGAPLDLDRLWPLAAVHADAGGADRAPYAPRRSRWNDATRRQDARQHAWRARNPAADPLGPFQARIDAYLDAHDAERHRELDHPRSSQAACLQVLAPAAWGPAEARAALAEALAPHLPWPLIGIHDLHFEAPHGRACLDSGCPVAFDARDLLGESTTHHTRLDGLVVATATIGGRPETVGVGIEFKYSEPEFGCCGGFVSRGNSRQGQWACLHADRGRRDLCYLHTAHEHRRYLADPTMLVSDPLDGPDPCPLLGPLNQLYRSHYALRAIAARRQWGGSAFLAMHSGDNPVLLAPERRIPGFPAPEEGPAPRYRALLRPDLRSDFGLVATADVLGAYRRQAGDEDWCVALVDRYG